MTSDDKNHKIEKTETAWRSQLSEEQFRVTRQKGTEPAFTGKYYACIDSGTYRCVCCGADLFSSDHKYDSGSGWPSFWQPANESAVGLEPDDSYGMRRIEVTCQRCGAHLGHVFEDGPAPTHERYCINSASLKLEKKE